MFLGNQPLHMCAAQHHAQDTGWLNTNCLPALKELRTESGSSWTKKSDKLQLICHCHSIDKHWLHQRQLCRCLFVLMFQLRALPARARGIHRAQAKKLPYDLHARTLLYKQTTNRSQIRYSKSQMTVIKLRRKLGNPHLHKTSVHGRPYWLQALASNSIR